MVAGSNVHFWGGSSHTSDIEIAVATLPGAWRYRVSDWCVYTVCVCATSISVCVSEQCVCVCVCVEFHICVLVCVCVCV